MRLGIHTASTERLELAPPVGIVGFPRQSQASNSPACRCQCFRFPLQVSAPARAGAAGFSESLLRPGTFKLPVLEGPCYRTVTSSSG